MQDLDSNFLDKIFQLMEIILLCLFKLKKVITLKFDRIFTNNKEKILEQRFNLCILNLEGNFKSSL